MTVQQLREFLNIRGVPNAGKRRQELETLASISRVFLCIFSALHHLANTELPRRKPHLFDLEDN